MSYFQLFLQSFLLEALFLLVYFHDLDKKQVFAGALFANAFTHPLLVFGWLAVPGARLLPLLLGGELFAFLAEATLYHRYFKRSFANCLLASFFANLLSWELGPILSYFLLKHGWVL